MIEFDIWDFYRMRKVAVLELKQKGLFIKLVKCKISLDSNPSFEFGQSWISDDDFSVTACC